jgi:3-oxoadipate enol-lactonase
MQTFSFDNTWLAYAEEGEGEPLVFLNGIMMTMASWSAQSSYFSRNYRCVFHDFRDQLWSGRHPATYSMHSHASDLARLLDHLGIDRCHIVGTSYGGEVGMLFAMAFPDRVRTLTAIACVPWSDALLQFQVGLWRNAAQWSAQWLYELLAAFSFSGTFLGANPSYIQQGIERLSLLPPDYFEGFIRLCDAFLKLDLSGQLEEIKVPALIISPGADILKAPWYSRYMAEKIPGAILWEIPRAGHAVVLEQPEAINSRVDQFLQLHRQV